MPTTAHVVPDDLEPGRRYRVRFRSHLGRWETFTGVFKRVYVAHRTLWFEFDVDDFGGAVPFDYPALAAGKIRAA